jgi:hypothetical protein
MHVFTVVHGSEAREPACAVHQSDGATIAVGLQSRELGTYGVGNQRVSDRIDFEPGTAVDLDYGTHKAMSHVRARGTQDSADRLHWPSLSDEGEGGTRFFTRYLDHFTQDFRSIVFLPSMRCSCAIWARAAASALDATTDSRTLHPSTRLRARACAD